MSTSVTTPALKRFLMVWERDRAHYLFRFFIWPATYWRDNRCAASPSPSPQGETTILYFPPSRQTHTHRKKSRSRDSLCRLKRLLSLSLSQCNCLSRGSATKTGGSARSPSPYSLLFFFLISCVSIVTCLCVRAQCALWWNVISCLICT